MRSVARGTVRDTYAVDLARKVEVSIAAARAAAAKAGIAELNEAAATAQAAELRFRNAKQLNAAADAIAKLAERIAANHDGSALAALDPMLPEAKVYRGDVFK